MAKANIYDLDKKAVGELELADEVFGAEVNEDLLYEVVKAQLASRRKGAASTKNRAEVSGSSTKLYKQKGTGNARHGTKRAPIFVGGGQAHGPRPKSWAYRPPRKMRLGALRSALSLKVQEGKLLIVDKFELAEIKTKKLAGVLGTLDVFSGSLIVDSKDNDNLRMSVRNLDSHQFLPPEGVNLYDVLRHEHLVLTKDAVAALEARCTGRAAAAE
ncbi:MAG: 50S ribosomal protein L4 [Deltaproteobacteria bacterium]|nr:MAG: 50S ribosomal protein L4 [Deltaproteobacteria bacterium]